MRFFIPHLHDNRIAAEQEWARYLEASHAPATSRRVYTLRYEHGGDRYEVKVGEPRKVFRRQTGPRGGYIRNAGHAPYGSRTGTQVSGIVDAGNVIYVWSYGPPFGGWANPSLVGRNEVTAIEYFDEPGLASATDEA